MLARKQHVVVNGVVVVVVVVELRSNREGDVGEKTSFSTTHDKNRHFNKSIK